MVTRLLRLAIIAAVATLFPGPGFSQKLPADCSAAAVPAQPVAVSIGGTRFTPKSIKLRAAGGVTFGDEQFDTYRLSFRSEDELSPRSKPIRPSSCARGNASTAKCFASCR